MTDEKKTPGQLQKGKKKGTGEVVVKGNDLVNAAYTLTINEHRMLLGAIGKIDATHDLAKTKMLRVEVQRIADLCNADASNLYGDMKKAARRMWKRSIVLKGKDRETHLRWVWRVDYFDKEGAIGLYFTEDVIGYLTGLSEKYTKYKLADVAKFRSAYAFRIYELLAQWQTVGYREVKIDELRDLLCLGDKYKRFAELRRNVIDKALGEINETSNLRVSYGYRKQNRRVVAIQFRFSTGTVMRSEAREEAIKRVAKPGDSWKRASERLEELKQGLRGKK